MALKVLLAATLRKYIPGYDGGIGHTLEVPPGTTVRVVAEQLEIPMDEVKLIMVNGIGSSWATTLQGDERVAFFPPVGGG
jgi:molybdopterin converting factor small subunit